MHESDFFDDFSPLTLSDHELKILSELYSMSKESCHEYGVVVYDGTQSDFFTSEDENRVQIPVQLNNYNSVLLYHSHTNNTLFSEDDFSLLLVPSVQRISVITSEKLIFSAMRGDGILPTTDEYTEYISVMSAEVDLDLIDSPHFFEWDIEKRFLETIRERAYRIARNYKWILEGGAL